MFFVGRIIISFAQVALSRSCFTLAPVLLRCCAPPCSESLIVKRVTISLSFAQRPCHLRVFQSQAGIRLLLRRLPSRPLQSHPQSAKSIPISFNINATKSRLSTTAFNNWSLYHHRSSSSVCVSMMPCSSLLRFPLHLVASPLTASLLWLMT